MLVTEITRRNLIDDIFLNKILYHGKISEIDFLNRLMDLKSMPSKDSRYKNMEEDITQHRINNDDWDDNWICSDDRINIIRGEDSFFLDFLCMMLHPVVRNNQAEVQNLLSIFNFHLKNDNFKIDVKSLISKQPIFKWIKIDNINISLENSQKINREFIKEQLQKCEDKLNNNDFDGAITNARSLLEDVMLKDIHKQIKGVEMETTKSLPKDFKEIKKLLNLAEKDYLDNSFKEIISGLTSIVNGISSIGNKMGDRHSREYKPERHHAKLVANSSKILVDFLYDVLTFKKNKLEELKISMYSLPYIRLGEGDSYYSYYGRCYSLKTRKELLQVLGYKQFVNKCDSFAKRLLLNDLLLNFQINSYDDADRFFIILVLFYDALNSSDIKLIFSKTNKNNQSNFKLKLFLTDLYKLNKDYLDKDMIDFMSKN